MSTTQPSPLVARAVRLTTAVALATLFTGFVACASTQSAGTQLDDSAIKADVVARIAADPDVNPFEISVDVSEGVVYLRGLVDERSDVAEAARVAGRAHGVKRVVNYLRYGDQSAGERLDDATITARVKAKLSTEMNPFNVDISTVDGVVYLVGRVASEQDKRRAEELARTVDGVRGVRNDLRVGDAG